MVFMKMGGNPIALLLMSVLLISLIIEGVSSGDDGFSTRLELIHRHAPELNNGRHISQVERIKDLLHHDIIRHTIISHKRRLSQSSNGAAIQMPLQAGRDYGIGQYFVTLKVGTPGQRFMMIVDTGSDLTWMQCRYQCGDNCTYKGRINHRRVFQADNSSSFKTVPCLSQMCKVELMNLFSLALCPTPNTPCAYDYSYLDGSAALGIFAYETVTVGLTNGRKTKLNDVLIGCTDSIQGGSFKKADGLMGLAYSKYSFITKATQEFGGKFSYCLVDHLSHKNLSNYLIFGGGGNGNGNGNTNESPLSSNMRYTKLELGLISTFYAVNIMGISIDGVMLKIPFDVWDAGREGGTIIDSGTSLMVLTQPAYQPVMATLELSLTKFERTKLEGVPMEYCFKSTGFDDSLMPKLAIHFVDGARFEPHLKSYIIDAADEIKCLGFMAATWPGTSIIGNIMQQNHLWEFDLAGSRLGFGPSTCS